MNQKEWIAVEETKIPILEKKLKIAQSDFDIEHAYVISELDKIIDERNHLQNLRRKRMIEIFTLINIEPSIYVDGQIFVGNCELINEIQNVGCSLSGNDLSHIIWRTYQDFVSQDEECKNLYLQLVELDKKEQAVQTPAYMAFAKVVINLEAELRITKAHIEKLRDVRIYERWIREQEEMKERQLKVDIRREMEKKVRAVVWKKLLGVG